MQLLDKSPKRNQNQLALVPVLHHKGAAAAGVSQELALLKAELKEADKRRADEKLELRLAAIAEKQEAVERDFERQLKELKREHKRERQLQELLKARDENHALERRLDQEVAERKLAALQQRVQAVESKASETKQVVVAGGWPFPWACSTSCPHGYRPIRCPYSNCPFYHG